jgi:photosystem II stability/assembly factor-like uncharacterized protein
MTPDGFLHAGTSMGKFFRSTNEGDEWIEASASWRNTYVSSMALGPNGLFAGTPGDGLFLSTDHGDHWSRVSGIDTSNISAVIVNGVGHVFVGTPIGVFRSTDGGNTWVTRNSGIVSLRVRCFTISRSGFMFVGTFGSSGPGLLRSTNNGDAWIPSNMGLGNLPVADLSNDSLGNMFAATGSRVYLSTDEGGSWQPTATPPAANKVLARSVGHVYAFSTSGGSPYRSTDFGTHWASFSVDTTFPFPNAMAVNPTNGNLFLATTMWGAPLGSLCHWGEPFKSTDNGMNWTRANVGMVSSIVRSVAVGRNRHLFCGIQIHGILRSTNIGASWDYLGLRLSNVTAIAVNTLGYVFAGVDNSTPSVFYLSTDNGDTWTDISGSLGFQSKSMALTPDGTLFVATLDGINKTTDNGTSWTQGLSQTSIYSIATTPEQHLFAGSEVGGIYRSVNNGGDWLLKHSAGSDTCIVSLASNASGVIFAGANNRLQMKGNVLRSTNDGEAWSSVLSLDTSVSMLAVNSIGHVFVATRGRGIVRSTDDGESWTQYDSGLATLDVMSLAIDSTGYLYVGTYGSGVYRTVASTTSVVSQWANAPSSFQLFQNYPNPWNPSTTIRYGLSHASFVTLTVYNTLGQQVAQLVNEQQQPGYREAVFHSDGLASGVYYYRLRIAGEVITRKMLLVR